MNPRRATAPRTLRADAALAVAVLVLQTGLGFATGGGGDGRQLDTPGWLLLIAGTLPLAARRRAPLLVTLAVVAAVLPYHALDYTHAAVVPTALVALFSLALAGPPLRSFLVTIGVVAAMVAVMSGSPKPHAAQEMLRSSGWILAVAVLGEAVRLHRQYVAAIRERAERAERTREEEAARRVAEERLRIARDLHDLLAHSITLIGVQTSVAAHVLVAEPDRLDRAAIAEALEGISDTCRDARAELRTTLQVLRGDDANGTAGPLPGLAAIPDLAKAAELCGARVDLATGSGESGAPEVAPAVGAAAYRIVQEALTNAVRHGGPAVGIRVGVEPDHETGVLNISVVSTPEPPPGEPGPAGPPHETTGALAGPGFGIAGMRERARSVHGTLRAGPRPDGGFAVTAGLPVAPPAADQRKPTPEGPA